MRGKSGSKGKSPQGRKDTARSFALRLDQAAADLNPFLTALAVGLIVLNLMLYIGLSAHLSPPTADLRLTATTTAYPAPADFVR